MRFLLLLCLVPWLSWGQVTKTFPVATEAEALKKLLELEVGDQASRILQDQRKISDELFLKSPFGKEKGSEDYFHHYLQRRLSVSLKRLAPTQIEVLYDPIVLKKQVSTPANSRVKVFLIDEFEIQNFTWDDIELKNPESFFQPIATLWEKKLRLTLTDVIADIELCNSACLKFYGEWLEAEDLKSYPKDFYFLHVSFLVRRVSSDPRVREMGFLWNGRVHASSFASREISKTIEISKETGRWLGQDQKSLNSNLATRIYQSGVVALETSIQLLARTKEQSHSSILALKGLRNIDESQRFINRIKKLNKALDFRAELIALEGERILFKGSYVGEEKSFTEFLSALKDVKLTRSYKIELDLAKGVYELKFVPN